MCGHRWANYSGPMRHFLLYAVIRLGLWVLLWWLLTLLDVGVMLAGVLAALIAMLISILFLDRLRDAAAMRWKAADERRAQRREKEIDEDAEFEDSLLDSAAAPDPDGEGSAPEDPFGENLEGEDDAAGPGELPDLADPDADGADRIDGADGTDGIGGADGVRGAGR